MCRIQLTKHWSYVIVEIVMKCEPNGWCCEWKCSVIRYLLLLTELWKITQCSAQIASRRVDVQFLNYKLVLLLFLCSVLKIVVQNNRISSIELQWHVHHIKSIAHVLECAMCTLIDEHGKTIRTRSKAINFSRPTITASARRLGRDEAQ